MNILNPLNYLPISMEGNRVFSASPLEKKIGFSRAAKMGNLIAVSGTAPVRADGSTAFPGDLYQQTRFCFDRIIEAIEKAGGKREHILRTRLFLKDISQWEQAARAHGEYFSEICPACTFAEVSGFIEVEWLIEIEADCYVP